MGVWANIYIYIYILVYIYLNLFFFFFLRGKLVKLEHGKSSVLRASASENGKPKSKDNLAF